MSEDNVRCPHCGRQTPIYPIMIDTDAGKGIIWCKCHCCAGSILLKEIEQ